jgi:hypothetical protein
MAEEGYAGGVNDQHETERGMKRMKKRSLEMGFKVRYGLLQTEVTANLHP